MVNNIYGNDELNCSDEPTAVRETAKATIEIVMPDVEMSDSTTHILQDDDSVSTFCSKHSAVRTTLKPSSHTDSKPTATTQATSLDDGSVSKLSDNTSRLLEFEDKLNQVANDLRQCSKQQEQTQLENKQMLTAIMNALQLRPTHQILTSQATVSGQPPTPFAQVNPLSDSPSTGGTSSGTAGSGS